MSEVTQIEKLHELITNVRIDIGKLDTKMDSIKDLTKKVDDVSVTANSAEKDAKTALERLNRHDKIIFWSATTIIGGLILGAIALLYKTNGG